MTTEILVKPGPFCLVAPSHCLIRCWHIINKALWYYFQFQGHVYLATQDTNPQVVIEMYTLEIAANPPPPPPPEKGQQYNCDWKHQKQRILPHLCRCNIALNLSNSESIILLHNTVCDYINIHSNSNARIIRNIQKENICIVRFTISQLVGWYSACTLV